MRPEPKYKLFHDESDTPPGVVALAGVIFDSDDACAIGDCYVLVVGHVEADLLFSVIRVVKVSGTVVSVEACDAARLEPRHRRSYRLGGENLVELLEVAAFRHAPALRSEACVLGGLFLEEQDLAVLLGIGRSACPKPLLGIEGFPCPVVGTHVVFAEPEAFFAFRYAPSTLPLKTVAPFGGTRVIAVPRM